MFLLVFLFFPVLRSNSLLRTLTGLTTESLLTNQSLLVIFTYFVPFNYSLVIWSLIGKQSLHIRSLIKYEDSFVTQFWLPDTFDDIESTGLHRHQMGQTQDNTLEDRRVGEGKS